MGIKNLFSRPPWESKDPDERAQAVASVDAETARTIASQLSQEDPDPAVRQAAIKRLEDPELIIRLCNDPEERVGSQARQRLLQLVLSGDLPGNLNTTAQTLVGERDCVEKIASEANQSEWRAWALERVKRPGLLGDIALKDSDPGIRQRAVTRIEQASTLRRVAKSARKTDKVVHKQATDKLEAMLLAEGDSKEVERKAESLCQQVEALVRAAASDTDAEARVSRAEDQWQAIARHVSGALQRRFDAAVRLVRAPTPASRKTTTTRTADGGADSDSTAGTKAPADPTPEPPAELPDALAHVLKDGKALLSGVARLDKQSLKRWDGQWKRALGACEGNAEIRSRAEDHYRGLRGELEAQLKANQAEARVLEESIANKLEPFRKELADGHFENSKALYGEIIRLREKVHQFGGRVDRDTESEWKHERAKLMELRDWQHWANNKRRKAMCEELEGLDPATLHPDAVAEKVRAAQAEWREMDQHEYLPDDRRKFAAPAQLWRRFQKASQSLYKPAKQYFNKRDEIRAEKRQGFIDVAEKMEGYAADEPEHDWKALESLYNEGRRCIRELNQIEPKHRGRMAKRLRAGLARLQPLLDDHYGDIERQKESLIEEVEALAEELDVAKATSAAKQAQRRWTAIGSTRRHRERSLWKRFRAANDVVFGKLAEERKEADADREAKRERLREIIAEVKDYRLPREPDPADVRGDMRRFERAFNEVELRAPDLHKQLLDHLGQIEQKLETAIARQREEAEQGLWAALKLCQEFEQDLLSAGQADDSGKEDRARVFESTWDELPPMPSRIAETLTRRRERDLAMARQEQALPDDAALKDQAEQADLLCIRLEFLAGVDSPEASRKNRMDFQVSRLSATLGSGAAPPDPSDEAREIVTEWCALGPVPPELTKTLSQRFERALKGLREHTELSFV